MLGNTSGDMCRDMYVPLRDCVELFNVHCEGSARGYSAAFDDVHVHTAPRPQNCIILPFCQTVATTVGSKSHHRTDLPPPIISSRRVVLL